MAVEVMVMRSFLCCRCCRYIAAAAAVADEECTHHGANGRKDCKGHAPIALNASEQVIDLIAGSLRDGGAVGEENASAADAEDELR